MTIMGCDLPTRYQVIATLDGALARCDAPVERENNTPKSSEAGRPVEMTSRASFLRTRAWVRGCGPPNRRASAG